MISTSLTHHPRDPHIHVARTREDFVNATHLYGHEYGVIWDRSDDQFSSMQQEYSDLFNNVASKRDQLVSFFSEHTMSHGTSIMQLKARVNRRTGNIIYRNSKQEIITDEMNNLLQELPHLKNDIELGIQRVSLRGKYKAVIWLLNDYPFQKNNDPDFTKEPHVDGEDTVYIQCGGTGLQLIPETTMPHPHPLENGNVLFMRGYNLPPLRKTFDNIVSGNMSHNFRALRHFGDLDKIRLNGRIAVSIMQSRQLF